MLKLTSLPVAILLVCLLSGCAAGLLSLLFQALSVGALIAEVGSLFQFGNDSTEFTLYFDGYDTGKHPNPDGTLNLQGLPAGHHLLTLSELSQTLGFHQHVSIEANRTFDLGDVTPIQGETISGRLRRQVGASRVPLAGVRVAAILGGGAIIAQGTGRLITLPPQSDTETVIMGFTNSTGNFSLGPAAFGSWIVTAAYPGYLTDAVIAQVSSGNGADDVDLVLQQDNFAANPATVQGSVVRKGGGGLPASLVALNLGTPFAPNVDGARAAALTGALGPLRSQPWFEWSSLATVTTDAAAYTLLGPPGAHDLYGFKYGYRAETTGVTLNPGEVFNADFALQPR